ncbi:MAG: RNA polymerase subunit alpha domain protein [Pirellula sp.]|nr:RNA polymerase subunit alpha domain protein [Pirellula sp.]
MSYGLDTEIKQLALSNNPLSPAEVKQASQAITADMSNFRALADGVNELETNENPTPAQKVRLGICYYLLGRNRLATATLSTADGGALALFYLGKAKFAQGDYRGAEDAYQQASKAGFPGDECTLARVDALRNSGDAKTALQMLDGLSGAVEQTAEYLYQRSATVAALGGNPHEVVALLERAVEVDPGHPGALFGLAMENDRRGNDDAAMELYQKSAARFPTHVGALLNLGILFEDRQQFERARQCYQRILDAYPNDPRARLFLKDAQASTDMVYDENEKIKAARLNQVLSVPVTDFELSVRSRNCLQKMGIMTLGDLTRCTEQELLSSKNFGETSLNEIKEMMASKGLELGQLAHERARTDVSYEPEALSPDEQAILGKSIADLNLSVRARKCMVRLNIQTVGELVRRTGDELLECKNFGVTSLNEVREKLTQYGIKLRGD